MIVTKRAILLPFILSACITMLVAQQAAALSSVKPSAGQEQSAPEVERVTVDDLKARIAKNEAIMIIDVRSQSSYLASDKKIKGAIRANPRKIKWRLRDVSPDKEITLYCSSPDEEMSARAAQILLDSGFRRVRVLKGGWSAWIRAGGQVESKPTGM